MSCCSNSKNNFMHRIGRKSLCALLENLNLLLLLIGTLTLDDDTWPDTVTAIVANIDALLATINNYSGFNVTVSDEGTPFTDPTFADLTNIQLIFHINCPAVELPIALSDDCIDLAGTPGEGTELIEVGNPVTTDQLTYICCIIGITDRLLAYIDSSTCH